VSKVSGVQPGTISGLLLGSPRKMCHSDVAPAGSCREYYMGEGGGFPLSLGHGESCVSKCPWLVLTPKGVFECELTLLWLVFGCKFKLDNLVLLPSLIPGLLARPSTPLTSSTPLYPLLVLEVGSGPQVPTFCNST